MTYHDNDVYFSLNGGYSLISGSYTVDSYYVTSGQDPDGKIHSGLTTSCGSDGKLTFRVGRKGSGDTANWFNDRIPTSQTTFNHSAGDLNFAFLGTLKLTIKGGILGNDQAEFTFSNVALAQGHSGASNNWWFGGQNCSYIQNDQVTCQGANAKGSVISFVFLRGGNAVSEVAVTPTTLVDTTAWMSRISEALTLDQLVLPGSHDAGMSALKHCNPALFSEPFTKTQSGSIGEQLVNGSRYFDIRVDYDYDELVTYHRTNKLGCNGEPLKDVFDQTVAFLNAHSSETVILKFSHIRDYESHKASDTKKKIDDLLNSYTGAIYTNSDGTINLAQLTIGQLRGKMILVFDYDDYINSSTGRFRYKDGSAIEPGANLSVYDQYSETDNYETMKAGQLADWNKYAGLGNGHLYLLSWTLTSTNPPLSPSIEDLAREANSKLPGVLYDQLVSVHANKPNIVYIDFVNNTTTQSIILCNF